MTIVLSQRQIISMIGRNLEAESTRRGQDRSWRRGCLGAGSEDDVGQLALISLSLIGG